MSSHAPTLAIRARPANRRVGMAKPPCRNGGIRTFARATDDIPRGPWPSLPQATRRTAPGNRVASPAPRTPLFHRWPVRWCVVRCEFRSAPRHGVCVPSQHVGAPPLYKAATHTTRHSSSHYLTKCMFPFCSLRATDSLTPPNERLSASPLARHVPSLVGGLSAPPDRPGLPRRGDPRRFWC